MPPSGPCWAKVCTRHAGHVDTRGGPEGRRHLEQVSSTALSEHSFRKGWGAKAGETRGTRGRRMGEVQWGTVQARELFQSTEVSPRAALPRRVGRCCQMCAGHLLTAPPSPSALPHLSTRWDVSSPSHLPDEYTEAQEAKPLVQWPTASQHQSWDSTTASLPR